MKLFVLLILTVFASEKEENAENSRENGEGIGNNEKNPVLVKIEEEEYDNVNKKSKFIGVTYNKNESKWRVRRWSKNENKKFSNGCYDDEETAAHASDTLARKLMKNGDRKLKLNFPDDHTNFYPEKDKRALSKYIGVSYYEHNSKWYAQRRSKDENKTAYNGCYDDEETAAHASDTLARKLMKNGDRMLKLNFPHDYFKVYPEEKKGTSKYIGVTCHKNSSKWYAQRWCKDENKAVYNGYYDNEETAAHASDTLARKLMDNGDSKLTLNFPHDYFEVYPEEKKGTSKYIGVTCHKNSKWYAQRCCKDEKKTAYNGCYDDEETAAHASDTLARKLMDNGGQKLKLNFPDDHTEFYPEEKQKKRKRSKDLNLKHIQNK